MKKYLFLLVTIIITSCVSENLEHAASKAAGLWNVQNYKVGTSVSANTDNGSKKSLTLTFEDLADTVDTNENIASISALTFIENLKAEDYDGYSFVKVLLKNNGAVYEKEYKISDVLGSKDYFPVVDAYFQKVKMLDFKDFDSFFSEEIPDSTIIKLQEAFIGASKEMGKFDKLVVTGFHYDTLAATKDPVIVVYADFSNANAFAHSKFIIILSTKKIIHFGINE
jgi:hypothetical protein